ncbi:hypothetical protein O181_107307 [Austropuccinia psidii MF-1]|uniref:Integrase catalytic domain-containing protein n=1 Tax=Austropuccinia psidii MF-1 TaxID=1389203 RepID=A0A9Q3PP85_9BASI|nr:hypothetical protein [Austropuccinia psidii MF-1]
MKFFAELVLLDSGATHHVTNNRSLFRGFQPVDISLSVATAVKYPVVGVGTDGGKMVLKKTLYCPAIAGTVLSIGRFQRCDGRIDFVRGVFQLIQDGVTYYSQPCKDRWYLLILPSPSCHAITHSAATSELFHQRFAHFSLGVLEKMRRLKAAKGLPVDPLPLASRLCESCSFAKSTHKPFACKSRDLVKAPGDVIVVDLVGPFPQSVQKHLYGLVIQDHFLSLVAFIPLRAKSKAVKEILGWLKTFAVLSGHQVKRLTSDNAGEFLSCVFKEGLQHLGITHETTVLYEHHQNGKVERVIRTLSETARAIILGKNVEVALWPWDFRHAAWVFNRILHANSDQTPWEIVTGMKPNISILRFLVVRLMSMIICTKRI